MPLWSAFNNAAFLVTGSLPAFGWVRTLNPGEGRFYNENDQKEARRVAFLGTDAAKQLFPSGGAVGQTIHLNDFPYTVIGVMEKKKQDSSYDGWDVNKVFIPFATMQRDFPAKPPSTAHERDQLLVTPRSVASTSTARRHSATTSSRWCSPARSTRRSSAGSAPRPS